MSKPRERSEKPAAFDDPDADALKDALEDAGITPEFDDDDAMIQDALDNDAAD